MTKFDIIIVGAGAAGLFAAGRAIAQHKSVCVLDMGPTPGRKVHVSGGGKCNFTNMHADYKHYFGQNPQFTRGALARFTPTDALTWAKAHKIKVHEKSPGQYFAESADDVLNALKSDANGAKFLMNKCVKSADKNGDEFIIQCTDNTKYYAKKLVIATGGISYPNLGTSDIGYKIAKQFGHKIVPPRPALCGIKIKKCDIFDPSLSGISLPVRILVGKESFLDNILFTHFGFGGPAIYRLTVRDFTPQFGINFLPNINAFDWLKSQKQTNSKKQLKTVLSTVLPERFAAFISQKFTQNMADIPNKTLENIAHKLNNTVLTASGFHLLTFNTAECTRGGIDTSDISSKTMESKLCPNLYFIGEVLDIAGDLGGYNLHWAWASASACELPK